MREIWSYWRCGGWLDMLVYNLPCRFTWTRLPFTLYPLPSTALPLPPLPFPDQLPGRTGISILLQWRLRRDTGSGRTVSSWRCLSSGLRSPGSSFPAGRDWHKLHHRSAAATLGLPLEVGTASPTDIQDGLLGQDLFLGPAYVGRGDAVFLVVGHLAPGGDWSPRWSSPSIR